jgi:hypothetical protein
MADEERTEPYVKIERLGRWLYAVNLVMPCGVDLPDGPAGSPTAVTTHWISMTYQSPWTAFGRRHAEWLGDRKLRKYIRREAWRAS